MKTNRILCIDKYTKESKLDSVKMLNRDQAVALLKKTQGDKSNVEFAREIGVATSLLTEIYKGRRDPAGAILEHIGLAKRVVYERTA